MTAIPPWALDHVPIAPFMSLRTAVPPGIAPLDPETWLHADETYAAQMAMRDDLIAQRPEEVFATEPGGGAAAEELLEAIVEDVTARHGARRDGEAVVRADGVRVPLHALPPIATAGRLAQEDFLVMEKPEGAEEHVLTSGVLCFPAQWTLSEKIGKPLLRIHLPVEEYPGDLARRVQRFFDGVRPGRPLWRANWHFSRGPDIVTPVREARKLEADWRAPHLDPVSWLRVERQTVLRLPRTGAAVFGVRTLTSALDGLTAQQWRGLAALPEALRAEKLPPSVEARALEEARSAVAGG